MERGSINGTPVWLRVSEMTGSERTVVKEAPNVDGAILIHQGQTPEQFSIEFRLINDGEWIVSDVETATLELRSTFLLGAPFTVVLPTFGELTNLSLAEPWSVKFFDDSQLQLSEGSASFIDGEPQPLLQESATADVVAAVSALALASQLDLDARFPDAGVFDAAIDTLGEITDWMGDVQGIIGSAFQPVTDFAGAINSLSANIEILISTPQRLANQMMRTAAGLLSLVPSLSQQGSARDGSAVVQDPSSDKPSIVFGQALDLGAAFDSGLGPTQGDILGDEASEEDRKEDDERAAAQSLGLATVVSSVCLAITSSSFATVNSVLDLSEALLAPVERLLNLPNIGPDVYLQSRYLWKATLKFLGEQAASLPTLRTHTTTKSTDAFSVLVDMYSEDLDGIDQVQLAVEQISTINVLPDPTDIRAGTTLIYLDPVV